MKKENTTYCATLIGITAFVLLFAPLAVFAAGLVPCTDTPGDECGFNQLMTLINNIIDFLLFRISMPLAAISFATAGIKMAIARGNEQKVKEAKEIFWYVLWGALIALSAWLIVKAIVTVLLKPAFIFLT